MWAKKPKKNKSIDTDVLGEITRPSTASSSLKIGSPTIRIGLDAAKVTAPKNIKVGKTTSVKKMVKK